MPIDTNANYTVSSTLRGGYPRNGPGSRAQGLGIRTFDNDDGSARYARTDTRFPSIGTVVESTELPHLRDRILEEDDILVASAPDTTNAFPESINNASHSSPAQMFLSMFSPPTPSKKLPDEEGQDVAGYTLGATVGHGAFSTIKKAYSSSGAVVAVKIVRRGDIDGRENADDARRQLDNEAAIWSSLNHEHVLPLFTSVRASYADFFITLYCPAGSLFDILKRDGRPALPQDDAGMMFRQVVRGLRYLHEGAKLVHRDIKLENVLVDEMGMCRIGDFGLAKHIPIPSQPSDSDCECEREPETDEGEHAHDRVRRHTTTGHTSVGRSLHLSLRRSKGPLKHRNSTPHGNAIGVPPPLPFHQFQPGSLPYASPELLLPLPSPSCVLHSPALSPNPAQDMWALGVLLYGLLTGRLPFWDSFEPRLQMKILHGAYDLPVGIGHGAERVLRGCLERIVEDRWSVDMVDEIAWGVGWGLAGDVSGSPGSSPVDEDGHPNHGGHDFKKARSRSRARPYPEYGFNSKAPHGTFGTDVSSPIAGSPSRSRSRSTRASSTGRSSERASMSSSMNSPLISDDSGQSTPFGNPYALFSSRGRKVQKNSSTGTSNSVLSGSSLSHSQTPSDSRSRSPSASPTTPPDPDALRFSFDHTVADGAQVRGRRRAVLKEANKSVSRESGRLGLSVVDEAEALPADRWTPTLALGSSKEGLLNG